MMNLLNLSGKVLIVEAASLKTIPAPSSAPAVSLSLPPIVHAGSLQALHSDERAAFTLAELLGVSWTETLAKLSPSAHHCQPAGRWRAVWGR